MSANEIFPFTCRCCARCETVATKDTLKLQSIHERPPGSVSLMSIAEIFIETTSRVNIKSADELPQLICTDCVQKILQTQTFLDMCIESERIMRSIIEENKLKQTTEGLYTSIDGTEMKTMEFVGINEDFIKEELKLPKSLQVKVITKLKPTTSTCTPNLEHKNDDGKTQKKNLATKPKDHAATAENLEEENTNAAASTAENEILIKEELEFMDYTDAEEEEENILTESEFELDTENRAILTTNKWFEASIENEPLSDDDDASITNKITETETAKKNECDRCGKCFGGSSGLKIHMHMHSKEKPYKCRQCDFQTTRRYCLIQHLEKHFSDKMYSCKLCPSSFKKYDELVNHSAQHKKDNAQTKINNLTARRKKDDELLKLNKGTPNRPKRCEEVFVQCDCVEHDECPLLVTVSDFK